MSVTEARLLALTTAPPDALEFVACAVCGSRDATYLHRKPSPEGEVFPIVRCTACGLVYVNPRRRQETLTRLYRDAVYFQGGRDLASGYNDYIGDQEIHRLFFNRQLDLLEEHVNAPGRLLDVGCAVGFLLAEARRRGWRTTGIELSAFAADYARTTLGLDVHRKTLREAHFPAGSFDAIVMDDVIEHLGDPEAELREAWRIVRTGGALLLHTPNADSPWYRVLRTHWVHLKPGEHLYYFSPSTLATLLAKVGFRVLLTRPSGKPTHLEYIVGRIKYYHAPLGRALHALTHRLPFTRRPFAFRSGELEALAVKP